MKIFTPIEKSLHFFQENFPRVGVQSVPSNKLGNTSFCFYRWNFFDFKISKKKKNQKSVSTASKIIEIFIYF